MFVPDGQKAKKMLQILEVPFQNLKTELGKKLRMTTQQATVQLSFSSIRKRVATFWRDNWRNRAGTQSHSTVERDKISVNTHLPLSNLEKNQFLSPPTLPDVVLIYPMLPWLSTTIWQRYILPVYSHVLEFIFQSIEDYTHRIGRNGRAGKSGVAVTFLTE